MLSFVYPYSMNLHVSFPGKVAKIPKEHDWVFSALQESTTAAPKGPSNAGATEDKTEGSNQNGGGGQKVSSEGSPVSVVCQGKKGGRPSSGSGSGSGGDDGGDDRRPNIPSGGCQGSSQCDVDDKEEGREKEQEERMHADDDDGDDDDDDDDDDTNHNDNGEQENERGSLPEQTGK